MTKILIDDLLAAKEKTRYWLAKQAGVTYPNMVNLIEGKTKLVKFETLEKICKILECELTDIIKFVDETEIR